MPLFEKHPSLLLGIWKIEETVPELMDLIGKSDDYSCFLKECKSESRKKEWLATRILLKHLLERDEKIAYYSDGAPYVPNSPDLSISISHTKGYAAVYCSRNKTVGVDIEYRGERVQRIKKRFLSEGELAGINLEHETEHLLIHWCAKETLFKLIRQEEVDFRKQLHVISFAYKAEGEIQVFETRTSCRESFTLFFKVTPEFVLTFNR
ncbi:4'-phosphopantetheinyl transferase superfamily protein [Massilibacteroides sp.]|uniref:4'-phosphopantetheinyl transferase family protein n=1 Tax=Massilibacteroides sp. TaxID=2034766 RepID=UPI0026276AC6|nr:4'-phosphopantetheinyl transferase superfamily protein [Massilibacteroides sp.]MDD4514967.1 4'-phosphopantetheinyl transferase superfamily protein [Massilibacteroides sp.]